MGTQLKSKAKQSKDITDITRETKRDTRQTNLTQTNGHHPSSSKHVKYSVQLKERIESNITSQNMHCITQISRLLFTLRAPLKNKHQKDLASL